MTRRSVFDPEIAVAGNRAIEKMIEWYNNQINTGRGIRRALFAVILLIPFSVVWTIASVIMLLYFIIAWLLMTKEEYEAWSDIVRSNLDE